MTKYLLIGVVSVALVACASSGGETGTGQDTPSVTVGIITGFGSVLVNGVKYKTDSNTSVTLDGNLSVESNLQVGMVVTLKGSINSDGVTGSASSIVFDDSVEGMVSKNTVATNKQLEILGQTVIVDSFDTVFESAVPGVNTFEKIAINNIVEVSGHSSGDGTIYATRIEVKQQNRAAGEEIELEGLASNVTDTTFQIGEMTILYSIDDLDNFEGENLTDGDYVEVKSVDELNAGQFVASQIELKNQLKSVFESGVGKKIEIEGIITNTLIDSTFAINGHVVLITNLTDIKRNISDIVIGRKAKVEGKLNGENQLVAKKIQIRQEEKSKIEGLITAIDSEAKTITVFGEVIHITNSTTVKDDRDGIDENDRYFFNFSNLSVGNQVEVSYYLDSDLNRIAIKLELNDTEEESSNDSDEDKDEWEIKGTITEHSINQNTIVVLGHLIDISNISNLIGNGVGQEVKVKGVVTNEGIWLASDLDVKESDEEDESTEEEESEE